MESESLYIITEVTELLAALIYYHPYRKKELEKKIPHNRLIVLSYLSSPP